MTYKPAETFEQWMSQAHINVTDVKACEARETTSIEKALPDKVESKNVFEMTESQFVFLSEVALRQGCSLEDWITFHARCAVHRARENHKVIERQRKEKKRYDYYRQIFKNLEQNGDQIFKGKRKKFGERRPAPPGMVYNCWGNLVREKTEDGNRSGQLSEARKVG